MASLFVRLEAKLDKVEPAHRCLCGLSLRACVMVGAVFMTLAGCVMLVHSPMSMVGTVKSLAAGSTSGMQRWAFVYVHLYLIALHLLTTLFLIYAVPLSLLALRSAFLEESAFLRSYFRMNVQVAGLLVLGSLFNLMLDSTLCDMRRADPYGAAGGAYVPAADVADSLERNDGRAGMAGAQCSAGANAAKLALSVAVAVTYCYLAWITYCYRRGLEQGSQLDDDVAAMAEAAAEGMAGRAKPRGGASGDGGGDGGRGASGGVGGFGGGYIEDGPGEMEIPVRARLGEMRAR